MIELRTLGTLELRIRNGPQLHTILAQPKRVGLLVYLTVALPRGFHNRDHLLALFWPELDRERAHRALRQSLYFLKRELRRDVLTTRGAVEVGVTHDRIWCDAVALEELLARGEHRRALELAAGELLPGFGVTGADGFERWLDDHRNRVQALCAEAAWRTAEDCERNGDQRGAKQYARAAVACAPADEVALRRMLGLMLRLGDRAGAIHEFDAFAKRIAHEYDLRPSDETLRMVAQIRADAHA